MVSSPNALVRNIPGHDEEDHKRSIRQALAASHGHASAWAFAWDPTGERPTAWIDIDSSVVTRLNASARTVLIGIKTRDWLAHAGSIRLAHPETAWGVPDIQDQPQSWTALNDAERLRREDLFDPVTAAAALANVIQAAGFAGVRDVSSSVLEAVEHTTERRGVVDVWTDLTDDDAQSLRTELNTIRRTYERDHGLGDRSTVIVVHWNPSS
jgi:hypothetical protein